MEGVRVPWMKARGMSMQSFSPRPRARGNALWRIRVKRDDLALAQPAEDPRSRIIVSKRQLEAFSRSASTSIGKN